MLCGHTVITKAERPAADTSSAAYNCTLEDNQIKMDLLSALGPNWLLHPYRDDSGPWCVDAVLKRKGFQENVGHSDTSRRGQYN